MPNITLPDGKKIDFKDSITGLKIAEKISKSLMKQALIIKSELKKYSVKLQDKVVKIKLSEAIKSINEFCSVKKTNIVKDSHVIQTMRYMELLKELKKSGSKDKKVI